MAGEQIPTQKSDVPGEFVRRALESLVCPACFRELKELTGALGCIGCGRRYPVVDQIPVLIIERAG
jgi:uncharacterized protein YbaR (Trm112 family)